jgi:hypothetical protein
VITGKFRANVRVEGNAAGFASSARAAKFQFPNIDMETTDQSNFLNIPTPDPKLEKLRAREGSSSLAALGTPSGGHGLGRAANTQDMTGVSAPKNN